MGRLIDVRNELFYSLKPLIPRNLQLFVRRLIAVQQRKRYTDVWPINHKAAPPPAGWKGWPEGKRFALVLQHDVDTEKGHDLCSRLMDLEEELGVRSCFNIVPERYCVSEALLTEIRRRGFSLGVHGLRHDGKLFVSYDFFRKEAEQVNDYLHKWNAHGFSSPSMISRLEWMHHLDIDFSTSSFDTDPFEPQPIATANTIFPFIVRNSDTGREFVELPYTLPQDFTLYIILREQTIDIWKQKLDWIAQHGGMALVNVHPDYLNFNGAAECTREEYPAEFYSNFVAYIKSTYCGQFWNAQPEQVGQYMKTQLVANRCVNI